MLFLQFFNDIAMIFCCFVFLYTDVVFFDYKTIIISKVIFYGIIIIVIVIMVPGQCC